MYAGGFIMKNNIKNFKNRIIYLQTINTYPDLSPILDKLSSRCKELINITDDNSDNIFIPEASSDKRFLNISKVDLIKNLGIVYWIFGFAYEQTIISGKYRIEFIEIRPNNSKEFGCFLKLKINFYKNDVLVLDHAQLLFFNAPTTLEIKNIRLYIYHFRSYPLNTEDFDKIIDNLILTWNNYFSNITLSDDTLSSYLFKSDKEEDYFFE